MGKPSTKKEALTVVIQKIFLEGAKENSYEKHKEIDLVATALKVM